MSRLAANAWPLGVAAAAFTVAVGLPTSDTDTWWHLASGRYVVDHGQALRVDVFSSTATGTPYALGEQLGEIALYAAYALGSWTGLALLRAALVAVAAFAVTRAALRGAPAVVAVPLVAFALILSRPAWTDRPQLFTLALFPLLLELLLAARDGPPRGDQRVGSGSHSALAAAALLVLVWSALHAGYALGVVLLWLFAIDALVLADIWPSPHRRSAPGDSLRPAKLDLRSTLVFRRPATGLLVAAAATTAAVSVVPGALPLLSAATHVASATRGIVEESPVDVLTPFGALFAVAVVGSLVVLLRGGGTALAALVLVPLLWLALSAQRYVPLFGFAAVPLVAPSLAAQVGARLPRPPSLPLAASGGIALALWVGALASVLAAPGRADVSAYPSGALAALRSTSGVLLNEYDWGGYLIWSVPQRPVFIDGRLFPYVDDVLDRYRTAVALRPGWRAVLERYAVAQALLRPDRPLAQALREDGWTVVSEDERYVLLERPK